MFVQHTDLLGSPGPSLAIWVNFLISELFFTMCSCLHTIPTREFSLFEPMPFESSLRVSSAHAPSSLHAKCSWQCTLYPVCPLPGGASTWEQLESYQLKKILLKQVLREFTLESKCLGL